MGMKLHRIAAVLTALVGAVTAITGPAHSQAAGEPGLMVVYGADAPTREGDVDLREQIFFSVPADLRDRLYVRVYDPEVFGASDFLYGAATRSRTAFRLFGGEGAFSAAEKPQLVEDGARVALRPGAEPVTGPGTLLQERFWERDRASDQRWVNLAAVRAQQGEIIGDRAYFRIDVQGAGGDDGNGFSLAVSLLRDRNRAPEDLDMFAYVATVRWSRGDPATQINFRGPGAGALTVQSFDAANGSISVVTDYEDVPVRVSGQNFWTSDIIETSETNLAIGLLDGFETPNDVTLAVFDAAGNPLPLQMPPRQAPVPSRPTARGVGNPLSTCQSVAFDASPSQGSEPLSYRWHFGDGATSPQAVIAHRYAQPGRYTARLEVLEDGTRPGRGAAIDVPVHVRNAPVAQPGEAITIAPGETLEFDGAASVPSDSPITRYRWTFGDGASATGVKVRKSYENPGFYRAVLRVEDDSRHPCNFGVATRPVTVNFAPVAEAGTDQSAVVGGAVMLDAVASYDVDGAIQDYSWNLGDGTVLTGTRVTHAYQSPGLYRVALTVTDDSGVSNNVAVDTLQIDVNAPPVPRIELPPRAVSVSEVANLSAEASTDDDGAILSYFWEFGDGSTADGEVVEYAWTRAGIFPVTLTVIDDSGTASASQSTQVNIVVDAAPNADAGPDQFVTASDVVFSGAGSTDSDGAITSYQWDFGDGATAMGPNVRHAFLRPGVYEVALTVQDDSTAPLNVDRDTMIVTVNAAPIADAGPPQTVAPGEEFVVSARASIDPDGEIAEYVWTFPDGTQARGERAAYAISEPGLHRIALTVYDNFAGGAALDRGETLITVNAAPTAEAGPDLLIAPGQSVTLDGRKSFDPDGTLAAYRWEFDDSDQPSDADVVERVYSTPGVYSAQLVVTDDSGMQNATASDSLTIRVNHQPVADAGSDINTDRLIVALDASGSSDGDGDQLIYEWDLGDGTAPVRGKMIRHAYPQSGIYPVTLRVDDGTGLPNATAIDASVVEINARPIANAGGNRAVCSGEPILFDASDSVDPDGGLLLYAWDFGDGTTSDLINPSKTYETPGIYPVTLEISNETGTRHGTDIDRIAALVREGPIADAGPDRTVCTNQSVRFDGSASTDADGAVNSFSWTFGDGGIGSGDQPVYIYEKPGDYTVTLTIAGEALGNCSPLDEDTAKVTVIAAPQQAIEGSERAAAGQPATFSVALSDLGGAVPASFTWSFSDGAMATGESATHTFEKPGEYLITLNTELTGGQAGCETISTVRKVVVNAAPEPFVEAPSSVAVGQMVTFDASATVDPDGAITGFAWAFGDGGTDAGVVGTHTFTQPGTYPVQLSVTDDAGVANSTVSAVHQIVVNPVPTAALHPPAQLCPGEPRTWTAAAEADTRVEWRLGTDVRTGTSVSHAFDRAGLYPVVAVMDDGRGLNNSLRHEEVYARVNAAPVAIAGPDRIVCPGDDVPFDASLSSDIDGSIVEWIWSFSDGVTLSGERVSRSFDAPADVTATLTVRDDSGSNCAVGAARAHILVNAPPVVDAGPDRTTPVGAAHDVLAFDASGAQDPDGHGLRMSWDFGDGRQSSGAVVRHRYSEPGEFNVRVTAQDSTGLTCGIATDSATVTATARP